MTLKTITLKTIAAAAIAASLALSPIQANALAPVNNPNSSSNNGDIAVALIVMGVIGLLLMNQNGLGSSKSERATTKPAQKGKILHKF